MFNGIYYCSLLFILIILVIAIPNYLKGRKLHKYMQKYDKKEEEQPFKEIIESGEK